MHTNSYIGPRLLRLGRYLIQKTKEKKTGRKTKEKTNKTEREKLHAKPFAAVFAKFKFDQFTTRQNFKRQPILLKCHRDCFVHLFY